MGAPDVRYMIVVSGADGESVLQSAEKVAARLDGLVAAGTLAGYESPSKFLPSVATQRARQASLPGADLEERLRLASEGLPFRAGLFAPFIADVTAARTRAPLTRADLDNTSLALAVDSMLFQRGERWNAVLPLTAPRPEETAVGTVAAATGSASPGIDAAAVKAALAEAGQENAVFVDLKAESDQLYSGYLEEALLLSLGGLAAICLLLLVTLRSPARMLRVLLPLAAAAVTVVATLTLFEQRLTILHLIGLLLIVAVGSNYALFFSGGKDAGLTPQTLTSLVFANLTTVAGFGVLGFSQVPILQAIGTTVGPGAVLALLFSAVFAAPARVVSGAAPAVAAHGNTV
jgi:predicted exporter